MMLLKAKSIVYSNVETWMLFAPPIKISGYAWCIANSNHETWQFS